MDKLKLLRERLDKIESKIDSMKIINGGILNEGFFPGADGVVNKSINYNKIEFMIIGQDQDTFKGYQRSKKIGNEKYTATWRNLFELINSSKVDSKKCFFTNCIPAVRLNSKSNVGRSPALKSTEFTLSCLKYLEFQISLLRPKAIICLGLIPVKLVSYLSSELLLKFLALQQFKEIDENNLAFIKNISFNKTQNYRANVITLYHPSFRKLNSKYRKFNGFIGNEAEIQLLNEIV